MNIQPTASYRPRPSVQRGKGFYKTGAAVWGRDVYHAQKSGTATLCGRDCSEWMRLDPKPLEMALADGDFCTCCASKLKS